VNGAANSEERDEDDEDVLKQASELITTSRLRAKNVQTHHNEEARKKS